MGVCGCMNPQPNGCHACNPGGQGLGPTYNLPQQPVFHPPGCICPPTSEQTCQAPMCPRRGIKLGTATHVVSQQQ